METLEFYFLGQNVIIFRKFTITTNITNLPVLWSKKILVLQTGRDKLGPFLSLCKQNTKLEQKVPIPFVFQGYESVIKQSTKAVLYDRNQT